MNSTLHHSMARRHEGTSLLATRPGFQDAPTVKHFGCRRSRVYELEPSRKAWACEFERACLSTALWTLLSSNVSSARVWSFSYRAFHCLARCGRTSAPEETPTANWNGSKWARRVSSSVASKALPTNRRKVSPEQIGRTSSPPCLATLRRAVPREPLFLSPHEFGCLAIGQQVHQTSEGVDEGARLITTANKLL